MVCPQALPTRENRVRESVEPLSSDHDSVLVLEDDLVKASLPRTFSLRSNRTVIEVSVAPPSPPPPLLLLHLLLFFNRRFIPRIKEILLSSLWLSRTGHRL